MKKILITATSASMIDLFNMDNICILQNMGYSVDVATNFNEGNTTSVERIEEFRAELKELNVGMYDIAFTRNVKAIKAHINAYRQLDEICKSNDYDFIHTQNPIASVITREVARKRKIKLIYMVHGFHFYKGAPDVNWKIYYPIEKHMSKHTDLMITINQEDYEAAKKFHCDKLEYVPGVGVDLDIPLMSAEDIINKKRDLGLTSNNILISVGELIDRKNHVTVIEAVAKSKEEDFQYLIVGKGQNKDLLTNLIDNHGLNDKVKLLGFRKDIYELLQISDVFIFPSFQEGLSKALMEAMSVGLPIIASNIRGNTDLIDEGKGGYLFPVSDENELNRLIMLLLDNKSKQSEFGEYNKIRVKDFSKSVVNSNMQRIYSEFIQNL